MKLTLQNVTKRFGDVVALNNINLVVPSGQTLAILGLSGCGKSTLLKVVAGIETLDSGTIHYDDVDVTDISPKDRNVGMVFQDFALYPARSGKGNLSYYFELRSDEERDERIKITAERMGVDFEHLLGRVPDTLSGGQKQRVAIARCIVRDPTIFLLDEPLANLDAKLRTETRRSIKKLLHNFGITTLYVTHNQRTALALGDLIAVMRGGVLEQVGTWDELYHTPANLFVATFLGEPMMTILAGHVEDSVLRMGGGQFDLPFNIVDRAIRVGVRPEDWIIDPAAPFSLEMTVDRMEHLPVERKTAVYGKIGDEPVIVLVQGNIGVSETVHVRPDLERLYCFAADDETILRTPDLPDDLF